MSLERDRAAFERDVADIGREPAEAFARVLDDLIAWSQDADWAIEFLPHDGTQKVVKFVLRGTTTPFWSAYPGRTVPTKLGVIDSPAPAYPRDVQAAARDELAALDPGQAGAKVPMISFRALCDADTRERAKAVLRSLLDRLSPQRTRVLLAAGLPPVVNGRTWLGHRAEDGAGKIDVMLIDGATRGEMEAARGAIDQHLTHLRGDCRLPVARKWDCYVLDRQALDAPAVATGSVSRQKTGRNGEPDDVELRVYGRGRVKLPFGAEESAAVTLRVGGRSFDATYHATPGNAGFTYLYQSARKGAGGPTLGEFLGAAGFAPGAKAELTFAGRGVTLRRLPAGETAAEIPPAPEASDLAPPREPVTTYRVVRDTETARAVKALHGYRCQVCGTSIELPDGGRYAEAHHVRPLGEPHNGPDVAANLVCVCPNHHAELDLGLWDIDPARLRAVAGHAVGLEYLQYHNEVIRSRWR